MGINAEPRAARGGMFAIALLLASAAQAEPGAQGWLQTRDQNPFVLATGVPLAPIIPAPKRWQFDASFNVANTELGQSAHGSSLRFDAETRETRISVAYAFDERWSARASLGHLWIGDGVLDSPVERFHRIFGFDNGDRGLLGTVAPSITIEHDGSVLYSLERKQSAVAPLLVDLTRHWSLHENGMAGISFGGKLPVGDPKNLSDSGSLDLSVSAFSMIALGDRTSFGARLGMLYQNDNELLGDLAKKHVLFGSLLLSYRLDPRWSAIAQYDAHSAVYKDLPNFFRDSSLLSFGFSRRFGEHAEFVVTLGEDLPATRTTDVVLNMNLRLR